MNILIDGQTLETVEINRGIGVYFKNVINNIVKIRYEHKFFITVTNKEALEALDPWVCQRIEPIIKDDFLPCSDFSRTEKFTFEIEKAIKNFEIDIFWIPNPLMVNILFPKRALSCKIFAMIHDIIPFVMPIKEWSKVVKDEYNRRLEFIKSNTISILTNSNFSKKDFIKHISSNNDFYVTLLAADAHKFYKKRTTDGINQEPYIVFTGGFDYRKNIDGAIKAFSLANKLYKDDKNLSKTKMFIVCSTSKENEKEFYKEIEALGIKSKVKLTGYLTDDELYKLYSNADLFFFPSLYEGFGLPILEAMLGGAYILSADNSSLPEICGKHGLLCDAKNIEDMAKKIKVSLDTSSKETALDKQLRQEYALSYSWSRTAEQTMLAFESINNVANIIKKDLAIVTPWPPHQTGIANYIYKLVPHLSKYFNIDIFVDNTVKSNLNFFENKFGKLFMIKELDGRHGNYDIVLYQMGNCMEYHLGIYKYLKKYPGIVEVHDYVINPFFYHSFVINNKQYNNFKTAMLDGYGKECILHCEKVLEKIEYPDNTKYPMCHSVTNISKGSIFHNHWSADKVKGSKLIPLACFDLEEISDTEKIRASDNLNKKINLKKDQLLIGVFGFVNKNKRPDEIMSVIKILIDKGYNIKLVFFGNCDNVENFETNLNTKDYCITGFLNNHEYEVAISMCHIILNLRYPTMGESSGTLCEALKLGKPVIVSEINQYTEFPDEVCWKVPVDYCEIETLSNMIAYLIDNEEVRVTLGNNAKAYAEKVLSPETIASQYYDILTKFM